jgi:biotin carboxyl carrier protein
LDKVRRGTREEQLAVLAATTASARQSLDEALVSAKNALLGAYTTTGEAFIGGVDALFDDADGANPQLVFTSTNNTQLLTAEHERFLLQGVIDRQTAAAAAVTYYDSAKIREEINTLEGELLKMKSMLDALIVALDGAIVGGSVTSTTISGYKATSNAARTGVLTTLTALSNTRGAINAAETALAVAQENEAQGVSGAQQEDIDVAAAQLASAQATLAQMVAQLEKTRVRAPVTGVVTTLNAEPGDFVTSFQEIGLIANDGALEVQTFVSSAAVGRIVLGGQAVIDGVYPGIVTSIAPGLDPGKRQVEVRVALTGDAPIPHGSRVSVAFRNVSVDTAPNRGPVLVPVSALKLIGDAAFVFTVREDGTLERRGVTLGQVVQSSVEILEGVDQDTIIVLDARGRNAGDLVVVTASD